MRRDIFSYRMADGAERWADPLAIDHRLRTLLGEDPRATLAEFAGPDAAAAFAAAERLAFAACHAFDLGEPFDPKTGEGTTAAVWRAALYAFVEWWEGNVDGALGSATCSKPTPDCRHGPPAASSASAGTTLAA